MPGKTILALSFLGVAAFAQPRSGLPEDVVLPGTTPTPAPDEPGALEPPRLQAISVVVVDPGHGGEDAGARAPDRNLTEKAITLAIAKKVEAKIAARSIGSGARVHLTRSEDERTSTADRTSLVNESRADLFVSLHVNASPSPAARGFQVLYHDATGAEVAGAARPRDGRAGAPLPAQPWVTAQRRHEELSAGFAEIVRESLAAKVALPDRGVKRLPLAVLEGALCPAVLVEIGFLTNAQEALALSTDAVQDAVAEAIAEAVLRMDARLAERNP